MSTTKGVRVFLLYAGISAGAGLGISAGVSPGVVAAEGDAGLGFGGGQEAQAASASSGSGGQSTTARDPGVRAGVAGSGQPISTLTPDQLQFFEDGLARFNEVDSVGGGVAGEPGLGLGPGYNLNSCGGCHAQPGVGGTSPSVNPQLLAATDAGATNTIPSFIESDGPVREARFPFMLNSNGSVSQNPDGGVHALFTIGGRQDAPSCAMPQPNFAQMQKLNNVIFRIPTPVFGAGLIENISEATIYANMSANTRLKQSLGISGHPNLSGNDGTVTRFGWKAQNKSLEVFSGEAYNVEMGVTNEVFPEERALPPTSCMMNPTPEDSTNYPASGAAILSDVVAFSNFMRFLAAPTPSTQGIAGNPTAQSIQNGQAVFNQVHCNMCHTATMPTGVSALTPGLSNQTAALYSDLLVHHMGTGLADNVSQGAAGPDEFRTAPLWGVGQRLFFLHDGRSTPSNGGLLNAIQAHSSHGSEANGVINQFDRLSNQQKQDLLNFLRSL